MKNILSIALLIFAFAGFSQDEEAPARTTTMGGEGQLSFSETGFGEYYSGGGLGSTTIGGILNTYLNNGYENGAKWDNSLRIDYGIAKVENTNGGRFIKSSDVLDVISKYGIKTGNSNKWFYSAAFTLLSQINDTRTSYDESAGEFSELVGLNGGNFGDAQSSFFSPADITLGFGMDYKPNDNFSAFIGPLSGKLRIISDDQIAASGLFGNDIVINPATGFVTEFDKTRGEAGASALAKYNDRFLENDMLSFSTGLKLFSNYLEDPQNVDVNWNTLTSLNPWKFITISYSTDLAYDDNKSFTAFANGESTDGIRKGVQFRNVLGIGLVHKFGDSKE